jgi:hypothetical protein
MCCPTQVWDGTTTNLYYWPNSFTYSGLGRHKFLSIDMLIRQTWLKRMQSETTSVHQNSIKYLYYLIIRADDLYRSKSLLREQIIHEIYYFRSALVLLVCQAPPKGRGQVLNTKSGKQSSPMAQIVRALAIKLTRAMSHPGFGALRLGREHNHIFTI